MVTIQYGSEFVNRDSLICVSGIPVELEALC